MLAWSWPSADTQSNSEFWPEQPMSDHSVDAIQGSSTKREPRSTPRIVPLAGSQRLRAILDVEV